jgi:hypothetical protein
VVDRVRLIAYERRHPDAPWLASEAVAFLEQWLRPDLVGFEWGSGRSTVWFARRVRHLISIEHDPHWYEEVKNRLDQKDVAHKVTFRCVPIDDGAVAHPSHYVAAISDQEDSALDFCLIDGVTRLRAQCALACLPKLTTGGIATGSCRANLNPGRRTPVALPTAARMPSGRSSTGALRTGPASGPATA